MVKFIIATPYILKIQNDMDVELPYDITDIDPSTPPGKVPANSSIELTLDIKSTPVNDPCVKLLILPYSYGRPVFVEFSRKDETALSIQDIDLTEMPGFTMVENDITVDHIMEFGHHVKLYGGITSNICLEVWCDKNAPTHHH
jgi:hypothetical protein